MLQELQSPEEYSSYSVASHGRLVAHCDTAAEMNNVRFAYIGLQEIHDWVAKFCAATQLDGQVWLDPWFAAPALQPHLMSLPEDTPCLLQQMPACIAVLHVARHGSGCRHGIMRAAWCIQRIQQVCKCHACACSPPTNAPRDALRPAGVLRLHAGL